MRELTTNELAAVNAALEEIEGGDFLEYQYNFILSGFLKAYHPGSRREDSRLAAKFVPVAQYFGECLVKNNLGGNFIDFEDPDAVELDFLKAWKSRQLPKGGDVFGRALREAKTNPLELPEHVNAWVRLVINIGFCLSESQPNVPFLIPVNEATAEMAGTSLRTWSLAVQEAIRTKFLRVVAKADQSRRKARLLAFEYKNPHVKGDLAKYRQNLQNLQTSTHLDQ